MAPKKPVKVEEVLPTDYRLKQRNTIWRNIMDKYSNLQEEEEFDLEEVIEACNEDASDKSLVSDVVSVSDADSAQESRDDISKQLSVVLPRRKKKWKTSGLARLMEKIEDQQVNLLSRQKVEDWLAKSFPGIEQHITQGHETVMSELNEDGDRMRFHRKQQLMVASKMDRDALFSLDTAKYVLSNQSKTSYSKVRVTTTFQQYTLNSSNAPTPKLHSISTFPAIEADPLATLKLGRNISKSDSSTFDGSRKENKEQNHETIQFLKPPEKPSFQPGRKKAFKKTVKKKPSSRRSPSAKAPVAPWEYEQAVRKVTRVNKVPLGKSRKQNIRWMEDSNSSSSEDDEVFTQNGAKRALPKVDSDSDSAECNVVPNKKASPSQMKALVEPFGAIALSPKKKMSPRSLDFTSQGDQTTNLTARFATENPKIANSTEINNYTARMNGGISYRAGPQSSHASGVSNGNRRCLWVYRPQHIEPSLNREEKIRITMNDLDLSMVTKPRHLEKFKKFSCQIHPNSSVQFFPSDSEDDLPKPKLSAKAMQLMEDDDSESFDEDDPLLTYNPRYTDRLNLRECPTWFN